jgi:hypothetical protein
MSDGGVPNGPCGPGCSGDLVCNPKTGECVGCLSNADCQDPATPVCDTSANTCVQCTAATDCPYALPGCLNSFCGGCAQDSDCPANDTCDQNTGTCQCSGASGCGGNAPVCLATSVCGCLNNQQCGAGLLCDTLEFSSGACVANCASDAGACSPSSAYPFCDQTNSSATFGLCLACLNDQQCVASGQGPYCTAQGCAQCSDNAQCAALDAGTPFCSGICLQCLTWSDCPGGGKGGGCNSASGQCGSCSQASDCPPDAGVCNANGLCQ